MKSLVRTRTSTTVLLLCCSLVLASCGAGEEKATDATPVVDLMAAAEDLDSLFLVAFNNGDAEALMQLYWNSPELRAYPPGEAQQNGYDAVKAAMTKEFAMNKGAQLEYTKTSNIVFADGVVGHGTFRWTMPMEGGEPMVMGGRYTEVKEMKDGRMVITVDHTSAPMPAPEEAPGDIATAK